MQTMQQCANGCSCDGDVVSVGLLICADMLRGHRDVRIRRKPKSFQNGTRVK